MVALAAISVSGCTSAAAPQKPAARHVFVIVMENKSPQEASSWLNIHLSLG
jgi:hypothetical protein